jgi:hypothetical protein
LTLVKTAVLNAHNLFRPPSPSRPVAVVELLLGPAPFGARLDDPPEQLIA